MQAIIFDQSLMRKVHLIMTNNAGRKKLYLYKTNKRKFGQEEPRREFGKDFWGKKLWKIKHQKSRQNHFESEKSRTIILKVIFPSLLGTIFYLFLYGVPLTRATHKFQPVPFRATSSAHLQTTRKHTRYGLSRINTHSYYRQLRCLAFSLRFWPKIKPQIGLFLSKQPIFTKMCKNQL